MSMFFQTLNTPKLVFGRVLRPGPRWGKLGLSTDPVVGCKPTLPLRRLRPLDLGALGT